MTDEQKRMKIQRALDAEFAHLNTTPAQRERLLALTVGGETMKQKPTFSFSGRSKLSFAMVMMLILLFLSMTAYAVTFIINEYYERVAQLDAEGGLIDWQLEDKINFVNVMKESGLTMNEEDYAIMTDATKPDDERLAAADRIIYDRYGELLQQEVATWAEQPESITEISPDARLIFLERYMAEHPEGITTREQYQQYTDALGYYMRDVYYPAFNEAYSQLPQSTPPPAGSREDAIFCLRSRMTELYSWDPDAVEQLVPEVEWDEEYQMWTVSGEVSSESMENCRYEPTLEGDGITRTETGYRLTILVDSKGNSTTNLDKDAFQAEHANDIEPQKKMTWEEGGSLAFASVMEEYSLTEDELAKLFSLAYYLGTGENNAAIYRYVYYPHYMSIEEPVFAAVVNLLTCEVTEVFSYREEDRTPEWKLAFFAGKNEQLYGWYDQWPIEVKLELLSYMRTCRILPEHAIWQQTEPDEAQLDAFVTEAFGAQGYTTAVNTMRMLYTLLGADMELWMDRDVALYTELQNKYRISTADPLDTLNRSAKEIDAETAVALIRTAFCEAWQLPESTMSAWKIEAQLVHDDHLDRGLIYYRVFLTCSETDADTFYGRRNFNYRVLVDGTIMDASMMSGWYSPAQEKAVLDEQHLYDMATYQQFIRYAQQNGLLMEYGDFFHWPLEHKKAFADQLRPIIQEKIAAETFADPRLIAFASHVYGVSEATMLTEQEVTSAARKLLQSTFGLTEQELSMMKAEIVLLDVSDEASPFWQIGFSAEELWSSAQRIGLQPTIYYTFEIDARSGECLNSYTFGVDDGQTGVEAWNRWY